MSIDEYLRILVDTSGSRLLHEVPEGIDRNAGKGSTEYCFDTIGNADTHDNVYREFRILDRKDASELQQDGNLGQGQADAVGQDAEVHVLP